MADFNSDRYNKSPYKPKTGEVGIAYDMFTTSTAPTAGDVVTCMTLPKDVILIEGWIRGDDMDSNGSPTLEVDVGISGSTTKYLNGGVYAGAKTQFDAVNLLNPTTPGNAKPTKQTAEEQILVEFEAAAATFVAGDLELWFLMTGADG